jgi:hypothetical protein
MNHLNQGQTTFISAKDRCSGHELANRGNKRGLSLVLVLFEMART